MASPEARFFASACPVSATTQFNKQAGQDGVGELTGLQRRRFL
jgi:hypothetical protein